MPMTRTLNPMNLVRRFLRYVLKREDGATTVEYAIMLALIITSAIGAILNAGTVQRALWFDSAEDMTKITPTGPKL